MKIIQIPLRIKKQYLRHKIGAYLRNLKGDFIRGDADFAKQLAETGYHISLQQHPSILFPQGQTHNNDQNPSHNRNTLLKLRELIKANSFNDKKDRLVFWKLGMPGYYVYDIRRMLADSGRPYHPYTITPADLSKEHIAVYTALTGKHDYLHEILYRQPGIDYILFTNNRNIKSSTWQVHYVDSPLSDLLLSRAIKMLPHQYLDHKYTATVYVDANAYLYGDISQLISALADGTTLALTRHTTAHTVADELEECIQTKGIDRQAAQQQYARYRTQGFNDDMGLAECGIIARRNGDPNLDRLMAMWYEEFCNGIHRDQISLLPCIHKSQFKNYKILDGSVWHNQYCSIFGEHTISQ